MDDKAIKLSHIVVYVNENLPKGDFSAFCTNVRSEDPRIGFTYLCYDNQFTEKVTERLCNLIDSLPEKHEELFVITDAVPAMTFAKAAGIACAALSTKAASPESFPVLYCIEDIEYMPLGRIERMWQRERGIPWTIARTERLIIREQTMDDLDSLYDIYDDKDAKRFVEPLYEDREKEEQYLRDYIDNQYRFYEFGLWAVVLADTGELIGRAGIGIREGYDIPELGYIIGKRFRRMGYAKEAIEAVTDYGMQELGLTKYIAFTSAQNEPSVRLLKSFGSVLSGHADIMGRICDMYILTKQQ